MLCPLVIVVNFCNFTRSRLPPYLHPNWTNFLNGRHFHYKEFRLNADWKIPRGSRDRHVSISGWGCADDCYLEIECRLHYGLLIVFIFILKKFTCINCIYIYSDISSFWQIHIQMHILCKMSYFPTKDNLGDFLQNYWVFQERQFSERGEWYHNSNSMEVGGAIT